MRRKVGRVITVLIVLVALVALCAPVMAQGGGQGGGQAGGQGRGGARGPQAPPLLMTTAAFEDGAVIKDRAAFGQSVCVMVRT